ncbi:uncharacterized protein EDB91DRAFT_720603 [Suillus paluster]|uniref:uncharacterized protein n=1 Tax=Suillus paluster TaxID=48578 RepID=UPI001B878F7F|nr:uncharacterized protein EDB91DRAFT_720603 [Suillus paluster]KAG1731479.1 hypothetical protein EDB91DRAFT_720603 [Suillus paluster]
MPYFPSPSACSSAPSNPRRRSLWARIQFQPVALPHILYSLRDPLWTICSITRWLNMSMGRSNSMRRLETLERRVVHDSLNQLILQTLAVVTSGLLVGVLIVEPCITRGQSNTSEFVFVHHLSCAAASTSFSNLGGVYRVTNKSLVC